MQASRKHRLDFIFFRKVRPQCVLPQSLVRHRIFRIRIRVPQITTCINSIACTTLPRYNVSCILLVSQHVIGSALYCLPFGCGQRSGAGTWVAVNAEPVVCVICTWQSMWYFLLELTDPCGHRCRFFYFYHRARARSCWSFQMHHHCFKFCNPRGQDKRLCLQIQDFWRSPGSPTNLS